MTNTMQSNTQDIMHNMALFGAHIADGERDTRPAPDMQQMMFAAVEMLQITEGVLADTCFQDEVQKIMWSQVYVFHRRAFDLDKSLDRLEVELQELIRSQDGSEIKTLELETATEKANTLQAKVAMFEQITDQAAKFYEVTTGGAWVPPAGTKRGFEGSGAIVDADAFLKARKEAKKDVVRDVNAPILIFSGGRDYEDHAKIWNYLDKNLEANPSLILATSAQLKGADVIATSWARSRKVEIIKCLPKKQYGKRAGFMRNLEMINLGNVLGVIVVKGSGIQEALVRDAKNANLKVKKIGF